MQRAILNRTNNSLERYHRELNTRFNVPHPALVKLVDRRKSVISEDADAPTREPIQLPRAAKLPDISDIKDSDTEEDGDDSAEMSSTAAVVEYEEYNHDEELNVSDDSYEADQYGPPGNYNSFDYETEEKS
ncbi:Hypothetical protein PHPALM_602 [Phytophthora palmivora]|uniref:Uncharacterized protein n=1 Tax=Phytophthora palmivora TaxID=4796 RepID=A0A2P4YUI0_9STRA|nr:Hypothetical protein PHPALM_602 [Phytophthora palmivora]